MTGRRRTSSVRAGGVVIGGGAPVTVQSMAKTDTRDVSATVRQIRQLEAAGCEIVRVAVPDRAAAAQLGAIKKRIRIPLVADIHFDHRLALIALEQGVDKLRLNPGNISDPDQVAAVARKAKERGVPIRIGVNSGSVRREKYRGSLAEKMVAAALEHVRILERLKFRDIVISLKASDAPTTIEACELISRKVNYPLHLGVTESGTLLNGAVKSGIGLSALLLRGIGDTIRVSLAGDPVDEVRVGKMILQSLGLRRFGPEVTACPACGRCQIDIRRIAAEVEARLISVKKPIHVAVMGCEVNGPGEARAADFGIAGGRKQGLIFRHGKVVRKVTEAKLVSALLIEINK